jgi:hypothetical protein
MISEVMEEGKREVYKGYENNITSLLVDSLLSLRVRVRTKLEYDRGTLVTISYPLTYNHYSLNIYII